jgi:hypothetical protein
MVTKGDGFLCHPILLWSFNPVFWYPALWITRRDSTPENFILRLLGHSAAKSKSVGASATPVVVPLTEPSVEVPPMPEVLTNKSILTMLTAGLEERVILAKIAATPARFDTRTDSLIELKRAGVPDRLLAAMIGKR